MLDLSLPTRAAACWALVDMDWQKLTVVILVVAAGSYTAQRAWLRVSSFRSGKKIPQPSCASSCGGCERKFFVPAK